MSLRVRLAVLLSLLVMIAVTAATATSYYSSRSELREGVDDFLRMRTDELARGGRPAPRPPRTAEVGAVPGGLGSRALGVEGRATLPFEPDAIVQKLDRNGTFEASTEGEQLLPIDDVDRAIARGAARPHMRTVTVDGTELRVRTTHVNGGGAVQAGRSLSELNAALRGIRNRAVIIGFVLVGAAATIGWAVASRSTRPLRVLTESATKIAATGDLASPTGIARRDEVGQLAASFDHMLAALRRSQTQQQRLIEDASHEFRTPLTALQANIELLQRAPDLDGGLRDEILASVRAELASLSSLFTEIVELATDSRDPAAFSQINLGAPAELAVDTFRARSDRVVATSFAGHEVSGNAMLLERAISNLLANADKHAPSTSAIRLIVSGRSVRVEDDGPGIAHEDRERIFDRFFRSTQSRGEPGSGLGLAIVKHIVEQHGGTVTVGVSPAGGAAVGFDL